MAWRLFGVPGWGSVLAESALAWVGAPFEFVDVEGFDQPSPARDRLLAVNPLARVPTLVGDGGETLTESAAIILRLAELHPEGGLAPEPGDPLRPAFLNRLMWFVSVLYPTFTIAIIPSAGRPMPPSRSMRSASPCGSSSRRRLVTVRGCSGPALRRSTSMSRPFRAGGRGASGLARIARSCIESRLPPTRCRRWPR